MILDEKIFKNNDEKKSLGEPVQTRTKNQIIQKIAKENKMTPNDVQLILYDLFEYVSKNLAEGNRFEFRDFGVFESVRRKQKVGRNPKKPDFPIIIPERNEVKFKPAKKLKVLVRDK